ncbi:DEAD/DEAH box helicase, partial [Candidatus Saccharibacteria bacterium]|nr:DEAD/DEAH box helicase [Candidatus Saccharibacteria bacterium]
ERKSLDLSQFNTIALDEVDRMLDMGFVNDVTYILEHTHPDRQSLFFSATMDNRVRTLIDKFSNDPVTISLKPSSTSDNVHQDVVRYKALEEKIDRLHDILISDTVTKVILFDETQRDVERLSKELINRGFDADAIHGGKTQGQRQRALRRFKQDEISILVATDVAARGIDVSDVTHVINYSIPQQYDDYIHRIGRAGRAGQIGYALTFVKH